jgi:threonine/homoserine/homoserine lactone efflux protein
MRADVTTESILFGGGLALAAAAQPGPLQAFLFSRVVRVGWRRTAPACLAPLLSDGPIAVLSILVIQRIPATATELLRLAGGAYLLWLAWRGFRELRRVVPPAGDGPEPVATLLQASLVNLLNPNPWLGWTLVLGPAAVAAWHRSTADGVGFLIAFYVTILLGNLAIVLLFALTGAVTPGVRRWLQSTSSALLGVFGLWQLWLGVSHFTGGGGTS